MPSPSQRPQRLRRSEALRNMVRETRPSPEQLIAPLFINEGSGVVTEISSMPGVCRLSVDKSVETAKRLHDVGVYGIMLFGVTPASLKTTDGTNAWADDGLVQQSLRAIKESVPGMVLFADTCFCEYTDHGHCGVLRKDGQIHLESTLKNLGKTAVSQARAGADFISPSGMLDGMVGQIRQSLDGEGFGDTGIMSYSVKYASAFYGPFRDAAGSSPESGDRKTHQMDLANVREGIKEVKLDIEQGADIVMVKPAMTYLDVVRAVKETVDVPVAAYNVSGEYAAIKAAAQNGWLEEQRTVLELTTSIFRAGADLLLTYWAEDLAKWLK